MHVKLGKSDEDWCFVKDTVNVLTVILLWFYKMLPLGKLGEGCVGSLSIISYNFMRIYNHLKKEV